MKIVVIGANGGIGRKVVDQALAADHRVVAILRTTSNLSLIHPNLSIIQGDVMHPETVEKYLQEADAVVSAIGGKMNQPTTLYSEGNQNLLRSMKKMGVRRGFFISASAIEISPVQPLLVRLATKYLVQKLFGMGYADQRIMERMIKESETDWTILRPPRLTDKPATGHYRFAINQYLKNCLSISRADVAHFIIHHIENEATYRSVVEIAY